MQVAPLLYVGDPPPRLSWERGVRHVSTAAQGAFFMSRGYVVVVPDRELAYLILRQHGHDHGTSALLARNTYYPHRYDDAVQPREM